MEHFFWDERWQKNQIGFHEGKYNSYLTEYFSLIPLKFRKHVLVPLCGKSADLVFLSQHCQKIIGVEFIEKAILDFFTESGLPFTKTSAETYSAKNISLIFSDFIFHESSFLQEPGWLYDRAALVALPEPLRKKYADAITEREVHVKAQLLTVFEYPQHEKAGPPFSVNESMVKELYSSAWGIQKILTKDLLLEKNNPFAKQGFSSVSENVFLLNRI